MLLTAERQVFPQRRLVEHAPNKYERLGDHLAESAWYQRSVPGTLSANCRGENVQSAPFANVPFKWTDSNSFAVTGNESESADKALTFTGRECARPTASSRSSMFNV